MISVFGLLDVNDVSKEVARAEAGIVEISVWMKVTFLNMSDSKTAALVITRKDTVTIPIFMEVTVGDSSVVPVTQIR